MVPLYETNTSLTTQSSQDDLSNWIGGSGYNSSAQPNRGDNLPRFEAIF
jgi:hypothetical protein